MVDAMKAGNPEDFSMQMQRRVSGSVSARVESPVPPTFVGSPFDPTNPFKVLKINDRNLTLT